MVTIKPVKKGKLSLLSKWFYLKLSLFPHSTSSLLTYTSRLHTGGPRNDETVKSVLIFFHKFIVRCNCKLVFSLSKSLNIWLKTICKTESFYFSSLRLSSQYHAMWVTLYMKLFYHMAAALGPKISLSGDFEWPTLTIQVLQHYGQSDRMQYQLPCSNCKFFYVYFSIFNF